MFLRSLASERGSIVKMASVVSDGFEVAIDFALSTRCVWHVRECINYFQSQCGSVELFLQQFLCRCGISSY